MFGRKESKMLDKSGGGAGAGDNLQLLKRSSTRSQTRQQQQQPDSQQRMSGGAATRGRQQIHDAFFGNVVTQQTHDFNDNLPRGASFFLGDDSSLFGGNNQKNAQNGMTMQRNNSKISKLEKNLSGMLMKGNNFNGSAGLNNMLCDDNLFFDQLPQLNHLQSIPMMKSTSDVPPIKRGSNKKSDQDTIGKLVPGGTSLQNFNATGPTGPTTRKNNGLLAGGLDLVNQNSIVLGNQGFGGGAFGGLGNIDHGYGAAGVMGSGGLGSKNSLPSGGSNELYGSLHKLGSNHFGTQSGSGAINPATADRNSHQKRLMASFQKFEKKKSFGAEGNSAVQTRQAQGAVGGAGAQNHTDKQNWAQTQNNQGQPASLLGKRQTRKQATKQTPTPTATTTTKAQKTTESQSSSPSKRGPKAATSITAPPQSAFLKVPQPQPKATNSATTSTGNKRQAKQQKKSAQVQESEVESSHSGSQQAKQRGRKRENWQKYVNDAMAKIKLYKGKLSTAKRDKICVKERQKWRNIVSAQQSRLKKKFEVIFLNKLLKNKDQTLQDIMNILIKRLGSQPSVMEDIRQDLAAIELPDPHPEEDCEGHAKDQVPVCLQRISANSSKFRTTSNNIADFRMTFEHKFLTPEDELNRYKHNDEKED